MSVKVMGAVWDLDLPSTDKLVLLAFADHADHNGDNARPGIALVAKKCGISERQVQASIAKLKSTGLMVPQTGERGGRGCVTSYRICVINGEPTAPITTNKGEPTAPYQSAKGCSPRHKRVKHTVQKGEERDASHIRDGRAEPSGTVIEPAAAMREDEHDGRHAAAAAADDSRFPKPQTDAALSAAKFTTEPGTLTLDAFLSMPSWALAYAAYRAAYPYDAQEFDHEIDERAGSDNPIRKPPEVYFRGRMEDTVRGHRSPRTTPFLPPSSQAFPSASHVTTIENNRAYATFVSSNSAVQVGPPPKDQTLLPDSFKTDYFARYPKRTYPDASKREKTGSANPDSTGGVKQ